MIYLTEEFIFALPIQFGFAILLKSVSITFFNKFQFSDESTRTELLSKLLQLNDQLKDYQQSSPVEDIIDPDLSPLRIQGDHISRRKQVYDRLENTYKIDENARTRISYFNRNSKDMNISEGVKVNLRNFLENSFFTDSRNI